MQAGPDIPISPRIQTITLRAIEMEADCILLAKAIDGVYDSDPKVESGCEEVRYRSPSRK